MEKENPSQPTRQSFPLGYVLAIGIAVVVTGLVVGGGVYFWQQNQFLQVRQEMESRIAELQGQPKTAETEGMPAVTGQEPAASPAPTRAKTASGIELPVVVYGRPGILSTTAAGQAELQNLEKKLVEPFTDYNNEDEVNLVSMYILIPQNVGEEYQVTAIFGGTTQQGTEEFFFGKREQEYDYWKPECMGPCQFSEAFKAKYPQIAE